MHHYSNDDQKKIEKAIVLASSKFAMHHDLIKPTLLHSIRVGCWLYFHGYERNIVIAGFLHDIIEDTNVTEPLTIKPGSNIAKTTLYLLENTLTPPTVTKFLQSSLKKS